MLPNFKLYHKLKKDMQGQTDDSFTVSKSIIKGELVITYKGKPWRDKVFLSPYNLMDMLKSCLYDIKPAIRRGDKVEINIRFNMDK